LTPSLNQPDSPLERTLQGHEFGVNAVAVTADGLRAISAGRDGTVRVWDLRIGTPERTLEGHTGEVLAVAVTADGHRAISAGADGTVRVWDLRTGQLLAAFQGEAGVGSCAVTVDGTTVVAGDRLGRVHILRWEEGTS
jgi:WD40 repeat protein